MSSQAVTSPTRPRRSPRALRLQSMHLVSEVIHLVGHRINSLTCACLFIERSSPFLSRAAAHKNFCRIAYGQICLAGGSGHLQVATRSAAKIPRKVPPENLKKPTLCEWAEPLDSNYAYRGGTPPATRRVVRKSIPKPNKASEFMQQCTHKPRPKIKRLVGRCTDLT